jgi:hypothetical protein
MSHAILYETYTVFYGKTHFVTKDRSNLHMFLQPLRGNPRFITSVTFNWRMRPKACEKKTTQLFER